ncbi:MAG TPA: response regulator, partial [Myxococcota bacterium]
MLRVLIVDDEVNLTRAMERSLGEDFDIVCCNSGHEALELLRTGAHFDVLVSDLAMPKMRGVELVTRASVVAPGLPAIILSGSFGVEEALGDAPIFRCIAKPCSAVALRTAIL